MWIAAHSGSSPYRASLRCAVSESLELLESHLFRRDRDRSIDLAVVQDRASRRIRPSRRCSHLEFERALENGERVLVGADRPAKAGIGRGRALQLGLRVCSRISGSPQPREQQLGGGVHAGIRVFEIEHAGPGEHRRLDGLATAPRWCISAHASRIAWRSTGSMSGCDKPFHEHPRVERAPGEPLDQERSQPRIASMPQQRPERTRADPARPGRSRRRPGGSRARPCRPHLGIVDPFLQHVSKHFDRPAQTDPTAPAPASSTRDASGVASAVNCASVAC